MKRESRVTKQADPVDLLVAARVRILRKHFKLSQEDLGKRLGLTFQQIQKYERGTNRISAGRLFQLAKIFDVPIQELYPGKDEDNEGVVDGPETRMITTFALSAQGWRLCKAFLGIKDPGLRKSIISLVEEVQTEASDSKTK